MKILNYKLLNEQTVYDQSRSASKGTGISQKDMRRLVGANIARDARIEKIPTVNAFRNLSFSFVTKASYNNYINANSPTNASSVASLLDVRNILTYSFTVLYDGDSCFLYPYKRQTLTLDSMEYVKSYLKLDLFRRDDETVQESVQQYFSQFNPSRTAENEFNVKNYELTVLNNFDVVNKKYAVPAEVINLRTFAQAPEPMFISMNAVSKEFAINTAYGQNENKYLTLGIQFTPFQIQGLQISAGTANSEPYVSFNNTFNGFNELTLREERTSQNRNTSSIQNFVNMFPYMNIFRSKYGGGRTYIIYTDKSISTNYLKNITQQKIKCVIGRNVNEFVGAEMLITDIT